MNDFEYRAIRRPPVVYWPQTWDGITSVLEYYLRIREKVLQVPGKRILVSPRPAERFFLRLMFPDERIEASVPSPIERRSLVIVSLEDSERAFRELVECIRACLDRDTAVYILDATFGSLMRRHADRTTWFLTRTLYERY